MLSGVVFLRTHSVIDLHTTNKNAVGSVLADRIDTKCGRSPGV